MIANIKLPTHIAIIMDGNGRWAKKRLLPRVTGHIKGVKRVKQIIKYSAELGIKYLTLFAFSRENWQRPDEEISFLMQLFYDKLTNEFQKLVNDGIKIQFIGDKTRLSKQILDKMTELETATMSQPLKIYLQIAVDYSGTYDITQAINQALSLRLAKINEQDLSLLLLTKDIPNPDLLIRTGGESRLSNFMLLQLAYSELYFTQKFWPDFTGADLNKAILWYQTRERRYGMTSEQIELV